MLLSHDVEKIVVTNDVAHVYIKKDKLTQDKYKDIRFKVLAAWKIRAPIIILIRDRPNCLKRRSRKRKKILSRMKR
jgi:hypothetical protein